MPLTTACWILNSCKSLFCVGSRILRQMPGFTLVCLAVLQFSSLAWRSSFSFSNLSGKRLRNILLSSLASCGLWICLPVRSSDSYSFSKSARISSSSGSSASRLPSSPLLYPWESECLLRSLNHVGRSRSSSCFWQVFWRDDRLDVLDHQTVIYHCLFHSLLKGVTVTRSISLMKGALRQCTTSKCLTHSKPLPPWFLACWDVSLRIFRRCCPRLDRRPITGLR